MKSTEDKIY